jgi:pimeloyl-ACP methyl ester carboxylesterase
VLALLILALAQAPSPAAQAPSIARLYKPGEESVWVFEVDGKPIGHHASKYVGMDDLAGTRAHHFQGGYRLNTGGPGGIEALSTGDLWTDDAGHPIRFVQQALTGVSYARVELAVADKKGAAHVVQGPSARDITVDIDPEALLLANNYVSHIELAALLQPPGKDATVKMFSGTSLQSFVYTLKAKPDGYDDSLGETLRMADGRLAEVDVAAAKLVIRRSSEHVDPIAIVPPDVAKPNPAFDAENVEIRHDDATIAGTITKKKGAKGPFPAVFFVSGSGPQDRNGYSSGIDLGTHEILDRLTEKGFLVLRVDDRGTGGSSAMPPDASFTDLIADARACVQFLEKREDVDPKRIAVIGHSEGGETAPILAEDRGIAAIVLLAAPGRSILEIVADQNRLALTKQGLGKDDIEKQMAGVRAFLAKLASDEAIDASKASEEEMTAIASRKWFQSHAKRDPIATIKEVKCPVLILQGATDFQVSPEKDAAALEAALKEAKNPDHELKVFAGLDHLFKKSPGQTSELQDYWKSRPIDPGFLDALGTWLEKRLLAK